MPLHELVLLVALFPFATGVLAALITLSLQKRKFLFDVIATVVVLSIAGSGMAYLALFVYGAFNGGATSQQVRHALHTAATHAVLRAQAVGAPSPVTFFAQSVANADDGPSWLSASLANASAAAIGYTVTSSSPGWNVPTKYFCVTMHATSLSWNVATGACKAGPIDYQMVR
jgi:ABC-type multidrug transport system fused ATPase/permease subunit